MIRTIRPEVDDAYWREFKKACIEMNISVAKRVERFIYLETEKYINEQIKKELSASEIESETENETDNPKQIL